MYQKSAMTFSSLTSSKDLEFGDAHIDVASSDKRLVRVTTNTYKNSGLTYINIKLFKKKEYQDDFRLQQRVGLTVKEFQEMIANVENISMGPSKSDDSAAEKKINKRIAQSYTGAADVKKQKTADKMEWKVEQLISKVITAYKFC